MYVSIFSKPALKASRDVMRNHLDYAKFKESAFSTEQFRLQRWLLGVSPKANTCPPELKRCLTVTEESQKLHLQLVVSSYLEAGRRLRPSARPRMRLSASQFELYCDVACVYATTLQDARLLASWTKEKEAAVLKAFFQKILNSQFLNLFRLYFQKMKSERCFVFLTLNVCFSLGFPSLHRMQLRDYWADIEAVIASKLSTWKLTHLGLWVDLVEPPSSPAKPCTTSELMEMEDLANAAKFREIKAKVAQDVAEMTAYNAQQAESNRRTHVVKVMHEKGQIQIGKSFLDIH